MILALKTAGPITDIWLLQPGEAIGQPTHSWESGRNLADKLLAQLEEVLVAHNTTWADLSGLVIFSGPGSFTSLRIGHTVLNALADSLAIPIVGQQGDDWLPDGVAGLATAKPGVPALPHYGGEANITRPKA